MEKLIEITDPNEMEKFVKSGNYLLVDDGLDEYVIHESDLVDYIYNRNEEVTIYKSNGEFLLSAMGFFLYKISYSERQKIIERLIRIQLGKEESKVTYYCESTILNYIQSYIVSFANHFLMKLLIIQYRVNNYSFNIYTFNNNLNKFINQYISTAKSKKWMFYDL